MKIHVIYIIALVFGITPLSLSKEPSDYTKFCSDIKQIQIAIQMFNMDAISSGLSPRYPRSADDLILNNYISSKDFKKLTLNSKAIFKTVPSDAPKSFVLFYLYRSNQVGEVTLDWRFKIRISVRPNKVLQLTPSRHASSITTSHPFYSHAI